ncbi:MAG: LysM peptidoglycan-binding domain-containing protein [Candidatus Omnitrophota bacterium]|jgi:murein DD-endopeptidase MepM/ murein hydrolase activator NlpD|nr:MAG: LysM peptidoglycan-binding domain-containing protein [Candidatus Omnitrophota bacterium]
MQNNIATHFAYCIVAVSAFGVMGCASPMHSGIIAAGTPGFYHQISRGQTLYGISRMHDTDLNELARINRITDTSRVEAGQFLFIPGKQKPNDPSQAYTQEDFIWPVKGRVIATFGQLFDNVITKGINIQAPKDASVVAARTGKVVFYSDNFLSFGKTVIIDHGDGFLTVYSRVTSVLVQKGATVHKGEMIAKVGAIGKQESAYLHFEIRKGHFPQNPYFFLPN